MEMMTRKQETQIKKWGQEKNAKNLASQSFTFR